MPSKKAATVEEASPSPPPLPPGPIPTASSGVIDQPIASLGEGSDDEDEDGGEDGEEDEEEDDEEEWDPSEERLPGSKVKGKGKAKATDATAEGGAAAGEGEDKAHPWQAVWSPDKNGAFTSFISSVWRCR